LREWLRRLHEEVPVTTLLVTHDREEAMDVADRVVVVNEGRVEQEGTPREVYDAPTNPFVMGFVGPVNRVGDSFVRPHDLEIQMEPNGTTVEAIVERVVHLGFEVRIDLVLEDGLEASAQLTRDEAESLELRPGVIVFARPIRSTVFSGVATPPGRR